MILFYFSATGNSKFVAELFCKNMDTACYSIEENTDFTQLINSDGIIGFCYPIYGSRVPRIMREFAAEHIDSLKGKKLIIFCTQMFFSGDGARAFIDVFPRGSVNVIYAEHFLMPNNVCNLFLTPLPCEKRVRKYMVQAEKRMQVACENIKNGTIRKRGFNPVSRALGLIQGALLPGIEKRAKSKVWIDDDCDQCGVCVSLCPVRNFECENGLVTTKNNCMMCYRCINKCPKKAISVFLRGKVKTQYAGVYFT